MTLSEMELGAMALGTKVYTHLADELTRVRGGWMYTEDVDGPYASCIRAYTHEMLAALYGGVTAESPTRSKFVQYFGLMWPELTGTERRQIEAIING